MGILTRRVVLALSAAIASGCSDGALDPQLEINASAERLQHVVDSLVAVLDVPGAVVAVRAAGEAEVLLASGIGDVASQSPMDVAARFRVASVTKSMVAHVVLQLVDEGALALTDTIARYLGAAVTNADRITVRQLLNHTSGVFDYANDAQFLSDIDDDPVRARSPAELLAAANRHAPVFAPGAPNRWAFSNTNYILLGMLIEQRTSQSVDAALRSRIFDPLGLSSAFLASTPDAPAPFSRGYVRDESLVDVTTFLTPTVAWAAGGVVSNAHDLVRWAEALAAGTGISDALRTERNTVVIASGIAGYGLGIGSFGGWVGHDGQIVGYETLMFSKPQVGTIVVLVNETTDGVAAFRLFESVRWAKFGAR